LHANVQKTVPLKSLQKQFQSQHALMVSFSSESFWSPQRKTLQRSQLGPMPPLRCAYYLLLHAPLISHFRLPYTTLVAESPPQPGD
jgi:hypothetical protein